jgi:L-seryl-tRNA(Ser) seleniumtransferase
LGDKTFTLRGFPRVDEILGHPLITAVKGAPHLVAREAAREAVEELREKALAGCGSADASLEAVAARAAELLRRKLQPSLRRAINATGVILHTGLGRAPLSKAAQDAIADVAAGYSNLQADVGSGERMHREVHVAELLRRLTGAEAAVVVNNNAAATVLVLNTLAAGREVVVSRGEMVEIGGAFRIPEIISLSGSRLVEVGCTNRTHLRDYRKVIASDTAVLLVVHQSNYRIVGYASQPPIEEVVALAHEHDLLCVHDLGSGALLDLRRFGLPHEPSVPESLGAGADVVLFSGDKLLGGPQCGIILGKRALLEAMHSNPYYRTFRVDKLTLAALEGTLRLFLDQETLTEKHAVMAMLTASAEEITARAEALAARLRQACGDRGQVAVEESVSEVGGGSLAGHTVPTAVVRVSSDDVPAGKLAARLRAGEPPLFARVQEGAVLMDLRTVLSGQEDLIVTAVGRALGQVTGG